MTRKDFEALANMLASLKPDRGNAYAPKSVRTKGAAAFTQWERHVRAMADFCAVHNGLFNKSRFFNACGYEG